METILYALSHPLQITGPIIEISLFHGRCWDVMSFNAAHVCSGWKALRTQPHCWLSFTLTRWRIKAGELFLIDVGSQFIWVHESNKEDFVLFSVWIPRAVAAALVGAMASVMANPQPVAQGPLLWWPCQEQVRVNCGLVNGALMYCPLIKVWS